MGYLFLKKICSKCKENKDTSYFSPDKHTPSGVGYHCRKCRSIHYYYSKDRERIKNKSKKWYYSNNKRALLVRKIYRDTHKQERKAYLAKRRNEIDFRIIHSLRNRLRLAIKNNQKRGSAIRDLGCSVSELKEHLEKQFQEGMSWGNYGRKGWHIDHIKPLSKIDLTDKQQFLEANHYTNLQPMWFYDNIRKRDKEIA